MNRNLILTRMALHTLWEGGGANKPSKVDQISKWSISVFFDQKEPPIPLKL